MEDEENKNQEEEDQENVDNAEDVTFISRFFLLPEELYKKEKYLISIMRISIFERIINTYLFQSTSKELSLYPYLENLYLFFSAKTLSLSSINLSSILLIISQLPVVDIKRYIYS